MFRKNESGAVDAMLVAVLVIVLAVGGFVLWRLNTAEEVEPVEQNVLQQEQTEEAEETESEEMATPEGWVEYTNEEVGIAFYYPPEWGEVELNLEDFTTDEYEGLGSGYNWRIYFSDNESIGIGSATTDFSIGRGGDGFRLTKGYEERNGQYYQTTGVNGDYDQLIENATSYDLSSYNAIRVPFDTIDSYYVDFDYSVSIVIETGDEKYPGFSVLREYATASDETEDTQAELRQFVEQIRVL